VSGHLELNLLNTLERYHYGLSVLWQKVEGSVCWVSLYLAGFLFVVIFDVLFFCPLPVLECVEVCFYSLVLFFWGAVSLAMQLLGFVWLSSALLLPALSFPLFCDLVWSLFMVSWKGCQLVLQVHSLGRGSFHITFILIVIISGLWFELRPKLDPIWLCTSDIPLVMRKSSKSGVLFISWSQ
jgi:hypothetical protein